MKDYSDIINSDTFKVDKRKAVKMINALIIDTWMLSFADSIKNPFMDTLMPFITKLGDKGIIWIIIAMLLIYFPKYRRYGLAMVIALFITLVVGEGIIKPIVARTRPYMQLDFNILINDPITYSFPSGHTASSFAAFGIFLFGIKKFIIPSGILAFLISFSRIYLGVHYFTDVLAGAALGMVISYYTVRFYLNKKKI